SHTKPYGNILETIGWTPLVRLNRVTHGIRTPVYAKAEFFNPGGSVKDRIGLAMIEAAEREGRLNHRQPDPVLHGAAGIEELRLGVHWRPEPVRDPVQPDQRCPADRLEDVAVRPSVGRHSYRAWPRCPGRCVPCPAAAGPCPA